MSLNADRYTGNHHYHDAGLEPLNAKVSSSTHHRKPRSIGGTNDDENLSKLPATQHQAWHTLFKNWDAIRIAQAINEYYLDPDYIFVVERRRNHEPR